MSRRDLHNYRGKCELFLRKRKDYFPHNHRYINKFYNHLTIERISHARICIYFTRLKALDSIFKKDILTINEKDFENFLLHCNMKDYNYSSIKLFLVTLRRFFKIFRIDKEALFKRFRIRDDKPHKEVQILSKDQVNHLIDRAENLRDKAIIAVLYECMFRPSDLFSIRKKDVIFDEIGILLYPDGKTGLYVGRMMEYSDIFLTYWNTYCKSLAPEDYIWLNLAGKNIGRPAGYGSVRMNLQRLYERCDMQVDKTFYIFRHSGNTHLLKQGVPDSIVNMMSGRKKSSRAIERYNHLMARDIDEVLLAKKGIKKEYNGGANSCLRCKHVNPPTYNFCAKCGLPLDRNKVQELIQTRTNEEALIKKLLQNDLVKDAIKQVLEKNQDWIKQ